MGLGCEGKGATHIEATNTICAQMNLHSQLGGIRVRNQPSTKEVGEQDE